jgi:3-oxoacyl-[acyl-carrier-protein] synthase II
MVSPIGIGRDAFWASIEAGKSGLGYITAYDTQALSVHVGGEVRDFDPKQYVRPRKSLKVMSREIQFAFTAADLAMTDAGLTPEGLDPDRLGVVFGADSMYPDPFELMNAYRVCMPGGKFDFNRWGGQALPEIYPLWLLKYLPNMPACHVAIAHDARGPCNSQLLADCSALSALVEGVHAVERGVADCMIVGGTSNRLDPTILTFRTNQWYTRWEGPPDGAHRPFDARRSGQAPGEGAGALIIESFDHARARGANILARVLSTASRFEAVEDGDAPRGIAIRRSITAALQAADLEPKQVGHVNAHGFGTVAHDRVEAEAIREILGEVAVTAPKSYFGNMGAASGAVELAASVIGMSRGKIPATINSENADPSCPINVVRQPQEPRQHTALILNQSTSGQAIAVLIAAE